MVDTEQNCRDLDHPRQQYSLYLPSKEELQQKLQIKMNKYAQKPAPPKPKPVVEEPEQQLDPVQELWERPKQEVSRLMTGKSQKTQQRLLEL